MGTAKKASVATSGVGVMSAAMTTMARMAYERVLRMIS